MQADFLKGGEYFDLYQKLFQYHKKHENAYEKEDWDAAVDGLKQFKTEFEAKMVAVIFEEIEYCYQRRTGVEGA